MKGKEIITHAVRGEMPDREQVRMNCIRQSTVKPRVTHRTVWLSGVTMACIALVVAVAIIFQLSGGTTNGGGMVAFALSIETPAAGTVLIEDTSVDYANDPNRLAASVSFVENYPQFRFYITGTDIASIEITTMTESVRAHDWTETLDKRFWNHDLYYEDIILGDEVYQYIPARSGFLQSLVLEFPEGFTDYDRVWYTWLAHDLYEWASEDSNSRIQGVGGMTTQEIQEKYANMTDEERMAIAAGGGTSTAGHILLDGYPEELLNDRITITITDRQGNTVTQVIAITISNNTLGQTVVTARNMK
jgi:hypothetical protein